MAGSQPLTAHPRQIARRECRHALVAHVVIRAWLARTIGFPITARNAVSETADCRCTFTYIVTGALMA